jgi:hypothetical protein
MEVYLGKNLPPLFTNIRKLATSIIKLDGRVKSLQKSQVVTLCAPKIEDVQLVPIPEYPSHYIG